MSGRLLPLGGDDAWTGGAVSEWSTCLLAPNPSPWTLEGTNTWLIAAPGSPDVVVVDPGPSSPDHLEGIASAVRQRGAVAQILLTHGHADHSAGALALSNMTGAPVRALDPEHVHGGEGLRGGETISFGDLEIHVIATPGHSADSLSFRVNGDGAILSGDTVLGRGTTVIAWPEGRLGEYLTTLDVLAESIHAHGIASIYPGHGPLVTDPAQRIAEYALHRAARLDEVREAMAAGARTADEVVAIVYAQTPQGLLDAARLSVLAQMEYLSS
jgi:glyoxylase-like metal-dependent hydrolase (beta-lactamase superfamily II)